MQALSQLSYSPTKAGDKSPFEILEQTRPPDPELVDLIERAFIAGQINSERVELAYL